MSDKVAGFFKASIDASRKRVGSSGKVLVSPDDDASQRGILLPSLALQYIFHSRILPFGKLVGLAGKKASMKSAFGFMLADLVTSAGGGFHLVETESKLNEHFMYSFIKPENRDRINVDYVETVEDAMSCLTDVINRYKASEEKNPFPLIIGIDSLAGSGTKKEYENINKTGFSARGYQEERNWLNWPFTPVTVCQHAINCWGISLETFSSEE